MPHERPSWPWRPYGGHVPPGVRVRRLLMDYSLSYGHHGLRPCSTHLGEGTVSMGQATGPIYTCETTGHAPDAVLDAHPERRRGTVSGQSAPNPMRCVSSCCQPILSSPLNGMQANSKPLVSSTHAQTTTMVLGQTGPRGAVRRHYSGLRGWRQNRSSNEQRPRQVVHMRSHEACCFSMMKTNVPDALVAMR